MWTLLFGLLRPLLAPLLRLVGYGAAAAGGAAYGAQRARAKQAEATARAATERDRTDDEVRRHSDAEQVEDLERWERR